MAGFQAGAGHQADKESLSRARPGKSPWFQKGAVSHQCFANGQASAKFCAPCSGLLAASCKIFPEVKFVSQMALQSWILAERFAAGAGKGGRDLLQARNSVQEADAAVDQHALEAEARPAQAWQPLRGVAGRQAPPGRAAGAAADGGAVREGQPITRAALQRPCCAVRGDCARGHGGACGAAEHSGLDKAWNSPFFHVFACFLGGATIHQK